MTGRIENHWRGFGLPDSELPNFLVVLSQEINTAWASEYASSTEQSLGLDNYLRVIKQVGRFAGNVRMMAADWVLNGDGAQQEIGKTVLVHQHLPSVIKGVNRVRRDYPEANIDEGHLLNKGVEETLLLLRNSDTKLVTLPQRVNTLVFEEGQKMLRGNLVQLPMEEIVDQPEEPTDEQDLLDAPSPTSNVPVYEEVATMQVEAASHHLLQEQVQEVLDSMTDRERQVMRLRFGIEDGRSRTLEEVGKEFGVTKERARQIEAKALKKLRFPRRTKKLKDYLE